MGLDQTAYIKDVDGNEIELQYWRKHNALNGFMHSLFLNKGNDGEFNCEELELSAEDIDDLERLVVEDELPETHGFFFGGDSRTDEFQKKETLKFIVAAREHLEYGDKVFYSCSW